MSCVRNHCKTFFSPTKGSSHVDERDGDTACKKKKK